MKNIVLFAIIAVATLALAACTGKNKEEAQEVKSLVLYYSQEGTTRAVAEEIQRLTGADIEAVEAAEPYSGTYAETIERVKKEREDGVLPELKELGVNVADYDVVYLGYPVWFGTFAPPMRALLSKLQLDGKKVVPFCSFGSGGLEATVGELREAFPGVEILDGYGVRAARKDKIQGEVERFLIEKGLIEGEVEALPEFSAQQPVGKEEKTVFDVACGNYQFPLGTPVSFGKRAIAGGTEYEFKAKSQSPDGEEVETTIYVVETLVDGDMIVTEFTRVVR